MHGHDAGAGAAAGGQPDIVDERLLAFGVQVDRARRGRQVLRKGGRQGGRVRAGHAYVVDEGGGRDGKGGIDIVRGGRRSGTVQSACVRPPRDPRGCNHNVAPAMV